MKDPVRITIKQARTIAAVARTRGLEHAAHSLNVSQPVASRTIAAAEKMLGTKLFQRGWSGAEPTIAGEAILQRCSSALQLIERAEDDIQKISGTRPKLTNFLRWHHLDALSAVVRLGSTSLASEHLDVTQPAISRSITAISQYAAQPLFKRQRNGLNPLHVAHRLGSLRDELHGVLGTIDVESLDTNPGLTGRLAVGMLPFSGQDFVARVFGALTNTHPELRLIAVPGSYDMLAKALGRGEIDCVIGILRNKIPYPDLKQIFLYDEKFTLVARKDHSCHLTARTMADLQGENWIVAPHGTPIRAYFEGLFKRSGTAPPSQTCEILSFGDAERVVAHSDSIAILSYSDEQVLNLPNSLKKLRVELPAAQIAIGLTVRSQGDMSETLQLFQKLLSDCLQSN